MKTLLLCALLLASPGGDREKGLQLYKAGRYAEAAAAFRAAIAGEGDSAELQYNLALASWRAGDLPTAEIAVEKYAALSGDARADLHAGVLGAVRYDEAKALEATSDQAAAALQQPQQGQQEAPPDPLPLLEQALQKANQAKEYFVRGASKTPSQELLRNTERALGYVDALQKKIDELKKQRDEQEGDDKNEDKKKSEDEKDDSEKDPDKKPEKDPEEKKPDDEKGEGDKSDQKKSEGDKGDKKPDDPKAGEGGEPPPEPKPDEKPKDEKQKDPPKDPPKDPKGQDGKPGEGEEQQPPEPSPEEKPAEDKPEPKPRHDAPGEAAENRELSPEQTQRLLEQLQGLDGKLKELRARAQARRRSVERDW